MFEILKWSDYHVSTEEVLKFDKILLGSIVMWLLCEALYLNFMHFLLVQKEMSMFILL